MFPNRSHCDITDAKSSEEAIEKAEALNPKSGKATLAIIDPPEIKRNCHGCGMFMKKDHLADLCPECKGHKNWSQYKED